MKIYVNVMELLIEQEIVKYLKQPEYKHLRGEIVSLMTYALNRVPPLYASSVQGLKSQINRGKQDYNNHIENAVRWSFTAVNKAPRQKSPDLTREIYQRVLSETRAAVKRRELSPIDLPEMIDSMVPQEALLDTPIPDSGEPSAIQGAQVAEELSVGEIETEVFAGPDDEDMTSEEEGIKPAELSNKELTIQEVGIM